MKVLYLSYTGMLEPLGQSQVLSYLRRLAEHHQITLVSYEKPEDWASVSRRMTLQSEVDRAGIVWHPLRYHKRFPLAATAYDVARGVALCGRLVRQHGIEIVHARGYIASLIAIKLKRKFGLKYVFDMRGFWPDEKVGAGTWSRHSPVYRLAKRYERTFLMSADSVVSLTHAGVEAMQRFDYLQGCDTKFVVIPTCADLERFHPPAEPRSGPFTLGYVGNALGWYRFEPVVAAFVRIQAQQPDARLLIVNRGQHETIRAHLAAHDVSEDTVELTALDFSDVPNAIRQMSAAAFFAEPTFAEQARAPTKLAEFLGCGVPCLVNDGIGDVGRIVSEEGVGVVIDEISNEAAAEGAVQLMAMAGDPAVRSRCVDTAHRYFSLAEGAAAYDALYRILGSGISHD